jgi:hypothetical protein
LKRKLSVSVCGAEKNELLAIVRQNLDVIHRSLNMTAGEHYQEMIPCCCTHCLGIGQTYLFTHQVLKRFTGKNISHIQCQVSGEHVLIAGLLKGFAPPPPQTNLKELLKNHIETAARLQGRAKAIRGGENDRNSFIAELLTARGYIVKDQIRWGSSASGKAPGELDMLIETPDGHAVSIVEALNLKNLDRTEIARHFQKLFLYDASGLGNNYILVYAESDDFIGLWRKYLAFLPTIETKYKIQGPLQTGKSPYTDIKIARTIHNRHDRQTAVYHLFINMKI